ncbi:MAG: hypothetical protein ACYC9S_13945, partial [Leptospirales bacterium]
MNDLPTFYTGFGTSPEAIHQQWVTYNNWLNVPTYEAVYDPNQAQQDANDALAAWIGPNGACPGLQSQAVQGCCITIYMDANVADWQTVSQQGGVPVSGIYGYTTQDPPGSGNDCTEQSCPDVSYPPDMNSPTNRYIMVNMTDNFLYQDGLPNPDYGLHVVPNKMWYTGRVAPTGQSVGYHTNSFYQVLEHEMGHWFGL